MARQYQLYKFVAAAGGNQYISDRNTAYDLRARFVVPPDFSAASAAAVAIAAGATVVLPTDPKTICAEPGIRGRKVTYFRSDGSSLSVVLPNHDTILADAIAVRDAIDLANANVPVVCAQLEGEYFPNLFDELAPVPLPPRVAGVSSRPVAPATKQYIYSGAFAYASDAVFAGIYNLPFKLSTNNLGAAPTIYAAALATPEISLVPVPGVNSCPGTDPRKPRHYIVQSLVTQGAGTLSQVAKIPVAGHLGASIFAAGATLAALTSTQCIGYKGEDNDRLHLLF